jgi:hypothetical protein
MPVGWGVASGCVIGGAIEDDPEGDAFVVADSTPADGPTEGSGAAVSHAAATHAIVMSAASPL